MLQQPKSVAILGGGIAGVYAAYELEKLGFKVTIFERQDQLGGLIGSFKVGGSNLEKFYHHFFASDLAAKKLIEEIGLADNFFFKSVSTALMANGQRYPLNSPLDLLKFAPLSFFDRLRTGAVLAYLKKTKNWQKFNHIFAKDWLSRYQGKKAFELLWQPLFKSKFGRFWPEVSMSWFWARIHYRTFQLGYIKGGYAHLFQTLAKIIQDKDVEIKLSTAVKKVESDDPNNMVKVKTDQGNFSYDFCLNTLPENLIGQIFPQIEPQFIEKYASHDHLGAQVLMLVLDRSFLEHYWLNVNDPGFPFLVVVDQSYMVDAKNYNNLYPIYFGNYLDYDDPRWSMSKEQLLDLFLPSIQKLNPDFSLDWIKESHLFAEKAAQYVVKPGFEKTILPFKLPVKNCYTACMSQVFPQDRGLNYSLVLVDKVINSIKKDQ